MRGRGRPSVKVEGMGVGREGRVVEGLVVVKTFLGMFAAAVVVVGWNVEEKGQARR